MAIIDIPNDAFANLECFNYHGFFGVDLHWSNKEGIRVQRDSSIC